MGRPFSRWPTVGDSRSRIQWEYLDDGELLTMNRDAGSHAFDRAYWMTDSTTPHRSRASVASLSSPPWSSLARRIPVGVGLASPDGAAPPSTRRGCRGGCSPSPSPLQIAGGTHPDSSAIHRVQFANNAARGAAQSIVLVLVQKDRALAGMIHNCRVQNFRRTLALA